MGKDYKTAMEMIKCNGGMVPTPIQLPVSHGIVSTKTMMPLLNANDHIPFMNVLTFGTCKFLPPTPAGPVPCVPTTLMAWKGCDMHYFVGGLLLSLRTVF